MKLKMSWLCLAAEARQKIRSTGSKTALCLKMPKVWRANAEPSAKTPSKHEKGQALPIVSTCTQTFQKVGQAEASSLRKQAG